ncbi:hypothetical protein PSC71_11780 [Devosia sp. J2-20]|uniref:hypothetical protein n=1 Tax=Devosia sp. J2-20 TaxID=3026161 RepID=UPI00249B3FCC|nr:hypothetical protein [Devosia sp. J2-20]WDQ97926.1 hypothetical protein PSC71_11780 [Devosia sp. J2-20]
MISTAVRAGLPPISRAMPAVPDFVARAQMVSLPAPNRNATLVAERITNWRADAQQPATPSRLEAPFFTPKAASDTGLRVEQFGSHLTILLVVGSALAAIERGNVYAHGRIEWAVAVESIRIVATAPGQCKCHHDNGDQSNGHCYTPSLQNYSTSQSATTKSDDRLLQQPDKSSMEFDKKNWLGNLDSNQD